MISNKHKLALSIAIAIATTGCASNVSSGKYTDQTTFNRISENNTSLNVSYVKNLDDSDRKIILTSDSVKVKTVSLNDRSDNGEELYELAGLDTLVVNDSSAAVINEYKDPAKLKLNESIQKNVTESPPKAMLTNDVAVIPQSIKRLNSSNAGYSPKSKIVAAPVKVMSAEDKIMSLKINPFNYQQTPEYTYLTLNKNTDRVWMSIDDVKVKEYLLDKERRLDPNYETELEKLVRPKAKLHFKVVKGSLKENLEALLFATKSTELVYSASLNHFFYNDFVVVEDSVLKVADRIIEPFKTPHQVVGMAYVNDILRAYTKNN
ncbi:MAG: hypothetical protein HRT95_04065 [Moritella sp.]|uniref:hypothetical protein n=1 Tax=Moritella sp. TaxID=78556 RepID=UPI001DA61E46|nr:hypothetical protein [Moritella sp.]NQZ49379.1 hypothetical protein [Moritella sp.]